MARKSTRIKPKPSPPKNALIASLACLTPQECVELDRLLAADVWTPLPGPQRDAYDSPADILLYGGAAGGGKTDLLLGLALTQARRSILFRREFAQLKAIEDRAREVIGIAGRYTGAARVGRLPGRRMLEFGAVQHPGDERKYQGRAHDLKAFDEITAFTEAQFRFLIGWNRTSDAKQRTRVVAAGNPPVGSDGDWIIRYWAPWLDRQHPRPAGSGELRWFAMIDSQETEVEGGAAITHGGEVVMPRSRSFIRARVEDNPYLMAAGYKAVLQALPEPLRTRLLQGDFAGAQEDDPLQVIPTAWIAAAQARWAADGAAGPMETIGIDVARGGQDRSVLTPRHGAWFGPQRVFSGAATPDGPSVLALARALAEGGDPILQIDVIGVGAAVFDTARARNLPALGLNAAEASTARDRTGRLGFLNLRAEWWWQLREALDPEHGEDLALPPDRELLADLAAPRWRLGSRGIQIESKDDIRARIGRSPDKGDSLVYAFTKPRAPGAGLLAFMAAQLDRQA